LTYSHPHPKAAALKSLVKKWFPIGFYILVAIFIGVYISTIKWDQMGKISLDPVWFGVATLLALGSRFWFAEIWMFLLRSLGANLDGHRPALFMVYSKSWLGRYIPGGAAWILGKIYFANKLGVSKSKLAVSSFLEGILQIIVVLISASTLLALDSRASALGGQWVALLVAISIGGLVLVNPFVFNRLVKFVYKRFRKAELTDEDLPTHKTIWAGIGVFAVSALVGGLSYFFLAKAFVPDLSFSNLSFVVGATNLASALSMLAVFAPAGLGVRETVQLATLTVVMDPAQSLLVTVFLRLWSIAVDVLFFGAAYGIERLSGAKRKG